MFTTLFASLLSTPAPTAVLVGIFSILLFAIIGVVVGPNLEGMNAPAGGKEIKKQPPSKQATKESTPIKSEKKNNEATKLDTNKSETTNSEPKEGEASS